MANYVMACLGCATPHVINPTKHQHRTKLCTKCRSPIAFPVPNILPNMFWPLKKLENLTRRLRERMFSKPSTTDFFTGKKGSIELHRSAYVREQLEFKRLEKKIMEETYDGTKKE